MKDGMLIYLDNIKQSVIDILFKYEIEAIFKIKVKLKSENILISQPTTQPQYSIVNP